MSGVQRFFGYARERYTILLNREIDEERVATGQRPIGPPWTNDPILRQYRFCNVFREDDRVTKWMREHITRPLGSDLERQYLAAVVFRWFNKIETGELLLDLLLGEWSTEEARARLRARVAERRTILGAAYMIKSPIGVNKVDGLLQCIDAVWRDTPVLAQAAHREQSLQRAHARLLPYPYLGPFMAYEMVTDMRHTPLLDRAEDIMSWASAGPGAARGLCRAIEGLRIGDFSHSSPAHQREMLELMRDLLIWSRDPHLWPAEWPAWEMRDVEHNLCEFDKYERARLGEGRPKQRFTPHVEETRQ